MTPSIKEIEALEAKIAKAKDQNAQARGALEQIRPTAEKEFGCSDEAGLQAKETELQTQVAEQSRKLESEFLEVQADFALAVGE